MCVCVLQGVCCTVYVCCALDTFWSLICMSMYMRLGVMIHTQTHTHMYIRTYESSHIHVYAAHLHSSSRHTLPPKPPPRTLSAFITRECHISIHTCLYMVTLHMILCICICIYIYYTCDLYMVVFMTDPPHTSAKVSVYM